MDGAHNVNDSLGWSPHSVVVPCFLFFVAIGYVAGNALVNLQHFPRTAFLVFLYLTNEPQVKEYAILSLHPYRYEYVPVRQTRSFQ
jgi:hypothetical protein